MRYFEFELLGNCQIDMDTEIKYNIVNAAYEGGELVIFRIKKRNEDKENSRLSFCAVKVLRGLKRAGNIQFFLNDDGLLDSTTEASYLINMYPDIREMISGDYISIFVKL